eukprot:gene13213-19048_t
MHLVNQLATAGPLLLAWAASLFLIVSSSGLELAPSIILLGSFDYLPFIDPNGEVMAQSRCTDMVDRAVAFGSSRINFVPTLYWRDESISAGPIDAFCVMDSAYTCHEFDQVQRFHLCRCNALSNSRRNCCIKSALQEHSGFSYADIMLNPIADAIAASNPPFESVFFSLQASAALTWAHCVQGEMGATVFSYPDDYKILVVSIRDRIARRSGLPATSQPLVQAADRGGIVHRSGLPAASVPLVQAADRGGRGPKVNIGLTFNFVYVDGNQAVGISSGFLNVLRTRIMAPFIGLRRSYTAPPFDRNKVIDLLSSVEFIGISAYAPLPVDFTTNQLQNSAFQFYQGFQDVGINLEYIMQQKGIELHYVEYGLGGGTSQNGDGVVRSASQAAAKPFWGVFGVYRENRDPWQYAPVREFMETFWEKTLEWLKDDGGPTYKLAGCYIWNLASWDVLAVHPESTNEEGSYLNTRVAQMVIQHNREARR